ncbi:MAG: helix-turn-helix transcriptional regulator [Ignavibacteria bacterium]
MVKIFAEDLKAIREEKNISLKSISQQTRLNITVLENLENGEFNFQPQAYIRAFLKQYIACLDLDVEEILFDYDLARSGKYKSNRPEKEIVEEVIIEKDTDTSENKIVVEIDNETDNSKEEKISSKVDLPEIDLNDKNNGEDEKTFKRAETPVPPKLKRIRTEPESNTGTAGIKKEKPTLRSVEDRSVSQYSRMPQKKSFSFAFLKSRIFRNILMTLFILLIIGGIYSLVNILFLEGKSDNPEIIRQNFDEVIQEQEKKLLGKKTEEEIQDSIKKANEESAVPGDSITLKVTALSESVFYLVTDSSNYSKPEKITLDPKDVKVFKAVKSFHISTSNTNSINISVDENPLEFEKTAVSKIKITKDGFSKPSSK